MVSTRFTFSIVAALATLGSACSSDSNPSEGMEGASGAAASSQASSSDLAVASPSNTNGSDTNAQSGLGGSSVGGDGSGVAASPGDGAGTGGAAPLGGAPGQANAGSSAGGDSSESGGAAASAQGEGGALGGDFAAGGSDGDPGAGGQAGAAEAGDGGGSAAGGAGTSDPVGSPGCGQAPTLQNSGGQMYMPNTLSVSGTNREFVIRWPTNYDNETPYRLILDLHGFGGSYSETAGHNFFQLWSVAEDSTIFIALSAVGGDWASGDNGAYVDAVLEAVEADLCIDTSRIMLEGFSQGAAMAWSLACSRPGVFRAVVGHSGGGVANPMDCEPIAYLGSGGLRENVMQTTQTDQFARWNGCTVESLPTAPSGGHVCTDYPGCPADSPVRWCSFDDEHTPLPTEAGSNQSWMPSETWPFFTQF